MKKLLATLLIIPTLASATNQDNIYYGTRGIVGGVMPTTFNECCSSAENNPRLGACNRSTGRCHYHVIPKDSPTIPRTTGFIALQAQTTTCFNEQCKTFQAPKTFTPREGVASTPAERLQRTCDLFLERLSSGSDEACAMARVINHCTILVGASEGYRITGAPQRRRFQHPETKEWIEEFYRHHIVKDCRNVSQINGMLANLRSTDTRIMSTYCHLVPEATIQSMLPALRNEFPQKPPFIARENNPDGCVVDNWRRP
jgi:hypothetical protein